MSESAFLKDYDPGAYQRPSVTVDLVLLGPSGKRLQVMLGQRTQHPFSGLWALPGGFVRIDESLDDAAARLLREKVGIEHAHFEQLYTFGAVDRDPRMRIITVVYLALMTEAAFAHAVADAPAMAAASIDMSGVGVRARSVTVAAKDGTRLSLAFDHADILASALLRLRGKLDYSDVGFAFLPPRFTLRELQDVHEAVLGTPVNKSAFRRRMLDKGWIIPTGARETQTSYRPAELFRFERQF